jgi:hypothetical protein
MLNDTWSKIVKKYSVKIIVTTKSFLKPNLTHKSTQFVLSFPNTSTPDPLMPLSIGKNAIGVSKKWSNTFFSITFMNFNDVAFDIRLI